MSRNEGKYDEAAKAEDSLNQQIQEDDLTM